MQNKLVLDIQYKTVCLQVTVLHWTLKLSVKRVRSHVKSSYQNKINQWKKKVRDGQMRYKVRSKMFCLQESSFQYKDLG